MDYIVVMWPLTSPDQMFIQVLSFPERGAEVWILYKHYSFKYFSQLVSYAIENKYIYRFLLTSMHVA